MTAATSQFVMVANSQAEEDKYDIKASRELDKPRGIIFSIGQMISTALGSGILSAHVAYMSSGGAIGLVCNIVLGVYMLLCLLLLGKSAHILYKRTHMPIMSYPEVAEAAFHSVPCPKINHMSKCVRNYMIVLTWILLYGACASYQLILAFTLKQLWEDIPKMPNYTPLARSIHYYLLVVWISCILISLIRYQWLVPFAVVGNAIVALCVLVTFYYSFSINPSMANLVHFKNIEGVFKFMGMIVFCISCANQAMAIENHMEDPTKYAVALTASMTGIVILVGSCGFFGYNAFLQDCFAPITINFPMNTIPKILKICVAIMIYITHGLNFGASFKTTFYYAKKCMKKDYYLCCEYVLRPLFVTICTLVAFLFPSVSDLMSFLGCFCLSNLAFIFPNVIYLLVIYERPGYGILKWKLLLGIIFILVGIIIFLGGTAFFLKALLINILTRL